MNFISGNIYHIYNRGNQKQNIFFKDDNYIYFLQKVRKYIQPNCDLLAYVLMPNHFHFLVHANEHTEKAVSNSKLATNPLSEGIRLMLSAYTKGINRQEGRTGNLIQQNTKFKCVTDKVTGEDYSSTCFYYIHQNPLRAGFVNKIEDWHYSSYRDYTGFRNGTLCNQNLARTLVDVPQHNDTPNKILSEELIKNIW